MRGDHLPAPLPLDKNVGPAVLTADVFPFVLTRHCGAASHHSCVPISLNLHVVELDRLDFESAGLNVRLILGLIRDFAISIRHNQIVGFNAVEYRSITSHHGIGPLVLQLD